VLSDNTVSVSTSSKNTVSNNIADINSRTTQNRIMVPIHEIGTNTENNIVLGIHYK